MPNWCFNEVRASEKVFNEIYDTEKKQITFNKLIPMPKTLDISAGGMQNISIKYALIRMNYKSRVETLEKLKNKGMDLYDEIKQYTKNTPEGQVKLKKLYRYNREYKPNLEEKELGINHLKELGNTYISNILNYGHPTWYEWRIENWGTKWDACNSYGEPKEGFISFETAWSPPVKVIEKLFEIFPKEDINWYYEEPGMGFAGNYTPDYEGGCIDTPCPVPSYLEEEEEVE